MDDALSDTLAVEVKNLLVQREIFLQNGPAGIRLQRVLVVGDDQSLVGGQFGAAGPRCLTKLAAVSCPTPGPSLGGGNQWFLLAGSGHLPVFN